MRIARFDREYRIAQAQDCDMAYDPATESFLIEHDERMESTQPGIYVCGEAAGIGGVRKAILEGELAGLEAATKLHPERGNEMESRINVLRRARRRSVASAGRINAMYPPHPHLSALARGETIVCRCEELSAGELQRALREGNGTLRDLKLRTRFGMGICQGRMCEHYATHELARYTKVSLLRLNN